MKKKHTVLFVDDEQSALDGFRTMMHSVRKEVKCFFASGGQEGLELLQKQSVDVVIADMRMPGMDGAEFLSRVTRLYPGTIRIVLSGYSDNPSLFKSTRVAHQFLTKPCNSEKIIETIRKVTALNDVFVNENVRKTVAKLDSLPVLPDRLADLSAELDSPDPNLKRISQLVELDTGMSTTLMKVANSSFFGFFENVTTPSRAVTLLGSETVRGLVLREHLIDKIDLTGLENYSVEKLWQHTLETGYCAKAIATHEKADKKFIDSCFLAGILHDVGKLALLTKMKDVYEPVLECVREEDGPIRKCELKKLNVDHAMVGAYLLGLWGFKEDIVKGVFLHHRPQHGGKGLTVPLVVHVANTLQHETREFTSDGYAHSSLNTFWLAEQGLNRRVDDWRAACIEKWSAND
ncbi:MAG: phosphohydrolase [Desulfovibrio sp.]|nr:phosphohydrolase [Desulfovibrio sp.]|tara:strand:- start:7317 stop:8531 length:1215 start_codon:yes stop_codon:yes gene_type:complete